MLKWIVVQICEILLAVIRPGAAHVCLLAHLSTGMSLLSDLLIIRFLNDLPSVRNGDWTSMEDRHGTITHSEYLLLYSQMTCFVYYANITCGLILKNLKLGYC